MKDVKSGWSTRSSTISGSSARYRLSLSIFEGEVTIDEQFCVFDTVNYWGLENRRRVILGETSSYAMIP